MTSLAAVQQAADREGQPSDSLARFDGRDCGTAEYVDRCGLCSQSGRFGESWVQGAGGQCRRIVHLGDGNQDELAEVIRTAVGRTA